MPGKILIVDDSQDVIELLEYRLRSEGYEVVKAADGLEAVRKIKDEKPDLIVLDIMMPKMDGFSVVQEIKKIHGASAIPVIIISIKDQMRELFKMEGVKDYVLKPFAAEDLIEKIKRHLPK